MSLKSLKADNVRITNKKMEQTCTKQLLHPEKLNERMNEKKKYIIVSTLQNLNSMHQLEDKYWPHAPLSRYICQEWAATAEKQTCKVKATEVGTFCVYVFIYESLSNSYQKWEITLFSEHLKPLLFHLLCLRRLCRNGLHQTEISIRMI